MRFDVEMSGRASTKVRLARAVHRLPLGGLHRFELPFIGTPKTLPRPVFLIALPRSGSTLAYQALVHSTDARYLSNLANLLFFMPFIGGLMSSRQCAGYVSDFRSRQGFVEGLCGPAEGLRFWSYWMGHGLTDEENVRLATDRALPSRAGHLSRVLAFLDARGRPFVSGYIGHCLVVPELVRLFPEALFVRLTRDPVDNALSILRIQLEEGRDSFSVMPSGLGVTADTSLHERVAAQVEVLNQRVEAGLDHARTIRVAYDDLCLNPNREMARVLQFCTTHGVPLSARGVLPSAFPRSHATGEWVDHRERLRQAFARRAESRNVDGNV